MRANDSPDCQSLGAFTLWMAAQAGARQPQQSALPPDTEIGTILRHRVLPPVPGMRPEASGKAPRPTATWPILACSFASFLSEIVGSADETPSNADAMFAVAVFVHPPIMVGWLPSVLDSPAVVRSSRLASRAVFVLNSAEYRCRFVISGLFFPRRRSLAIAPKCCDLRFVDEFTRKVLAWHILNTPEADFCVAALAEAGVSPIARAVSPDEAA
ncbi:hypothetical protein [Salipiger aestuarii]|uniref:hypothetical protein n=1 Tax=Salipiger aestuarii TaxID=568098 RepID=UPI0011B9429D|nr:hypothetical protein [Salipiger aestuarii]